MTDNLRIRIAAAIYDHPNPLSEQQCREVADAVIRELEAGYVLVPKNVTLVQWADEAFKGQPEGNFKHEHVTEWAADA